MAAVSSTDGSEDVQDFLRRIKSLSERRDQEDAERTRKLEEDIAESRRQRAARRADRERSLSPEKSSPVASPGGARSKSYFPRSEAPTPALTAAATPILSATTPTREVATSTAHDTKIDSGSPSPRPTTMLERTPQPPKPSPSSAVGLARSGTLSWQRRPASVRGPRSRPTSVVEPSGQLDPPRKEQEAPAEVFNGDPSRDQIARSLGAKDPTWFRQTADRGKGSPAYRKTSSEHESQISAQPPRQMLHGLSSGATPEPVFSSADGPTSTRSEKLPSPRTHEQGESGSPQRIKPSSVRLPAPSAQITDSNDGRTEINIPVTGRRNFERPESPTKGMGGFVQSAMMKRSDSVSKRWSAQAGPILTRQNSNARDRGMANAVSSSASMPILGESEQNSSVSQTSRPGSSHEDAETSVDRETSRPSFRPESRTGLRDTSPSKTDDQQGPSSPSKRWSPVKSTWLESALSKPESPKAPPKPALNQPSWMVELNKAKQQRGSREHNQLSESNGQSRPNSIGSKQISPLSTSKGNHAGSESKDSVSSMTKSGPAQLSAASKKSPNASIPKTEAKEDAPAMERKNAVVTSNATVPSTAGAISSKSSQEPREIELSRDAPSAPEIQEDTAVGVGKPTMSSPLASATARVASPAAPISAPISKTKPITPPKKDFRSNLKPRQTPTEPSKQEGLEFQNAFGKLKRTQTQNYKAPDELKGNILRGKAELTETGGPQKTVRRDELKEDLLKQKEVMKVKAREAPAADPLVKKGTRPVTPEAIAKRRALGSNESSGNLMSSPSKSIVQKDPIEPPQRTANARDVVPAVEETASKPVSNKFADRFNPALAGVLARRPAASSPGDSTPTIPSTTTSFSSSSRTARTVTEDEGNGQLQHMTKARARGPKRRAPTTKEAEVKATTSIAAPSPARSVSNPKPSKPAVAVKPRNVTPILSPEELVETKSTPVAASTPLSQQASKSLSEAAQTSLQSSAISAPPATSSPISNASTPLSPPLPSKSSGLCTSSAEVRESTPSTASSIFKTIKSSTVESESVQSVSKAVKPAIVTATSSSAIDQVDGTGARTSSPVSRSAFGASTAVWGQKVDQSPTKSGSPITLPPQKGKGLSGQEKIASTASASSSSQIVPMPVMKPLTGKVETIASSRVPPLASKPSAAALANAKSRSMNNNATPDAPHSPVGATQRATNGPSFDAANMFRAFFGEAPVAPKELEVDTEAILTAGSAAMPKIKTLRKSVHEITQDGKMTPAASGQEHVLFSDRMYLCTHVFGNDTGARVSEVYLWTGSGIADSSIEDVQLFAKKAAKDAGGKLSILRQGKETANFFQALGGIVITRGNSRSDSSSKHILRGQQHLGHLAFDEVPFAPSSLCSGFPYIVADGSGKVFLWKGLACNTDELSGARLISMDICPSGQVVEIEDGHETPEFLKLFPAGNTISQSSENWKHKPNYPNYRSRLYAVEWQERPVSSHNSGPAQVLWGMVRRQSQPAPTHLRIEEISPFTQQDLESENIYVLDAFFEVYVIIGPLANRKSRAFASALVFAQEYAILAASADNRPFIPIGTVVLDGAPRDMKTAFRRWDDNAVSTKNLMAGKARGAVGKTMKTVPLGTAVDAVRGR